MSKSTIYIKNQREILSAWRKAPDVMSSEMNKAVSAVTLFLEGETVKEAPVDKGILRRGIGHRVAGFVGRVFTSTKYAIFVHEGTSPHTIRPRNAKVLRFKVGGKWVYAKQVRHKGTKANPFLKRAFENSQRKVQNIFESRFSKALDSLKN